MAFKPEQRGQRWRGGFRHPVTGRKVHKTFDYQYEAEAWAITAEERAKTAALYATATLYADVSQDESECDPQASAGGRGTASTTLRAPSPTTPTLGDYADAYLKRRAGELTDGTYQNYRAALTGLRRPVGETGPLADHQMGRITKAIIQQWITDSLTAGQGRPSINSRLGFMRTVFLDAVAAENSGITFNPVKGIKLLTVDQSPTHIVTDAEASALFLAADPVTRLAAMLAYYCGLRWGEVFGLRAGDLRGEYLLVSHVAERSGKHRPFPKGKKRRVVGIPIDQLTDALTDWTADLAEHQLMFPSVPGGERVMDYRNFIRTHWTPAMYRAGLARKETVQTSRIRKNGPEKGKPYERVRFYPDFGFHDLRHTYGTTLADQGMPRHRIARLMGHADERTTGRYIHATDDGAILGSLRDIYGHDGA